MRDFTITELREWAHDAYRNPLTGDSRLDRLHEDSRAIIGHYTPYYKWFYTIAQELMPAFSVELGAWRGYASAHLAIGNEEGDVVTVDIHREDRVAQQICQILDRELPNFHYVNAWSVPEIAAKERADLFISAPAHVASFGKPIDFLFIDAWHRYDYAMLEWETYSPMLAHPALIVCDDLMASFDGMPQFWDELPGEKYAFPCGPVAEEDLHLGVPFGMVKIE